MLGVLGLILAVAYLIEFLSSAAGARWFGASQWGVWGVIIGGIVGFFFGLPGLVLGPIIGAFAFEILFAKQRIKPATKSTVGTVVGTVAGMVVKLVLALLMVGLFFADIYLF